MVKTDSYVQFEAGKLTYRVVPVTEEIIRMIVSGKEIKEAQDSLIIEKKEYPEVDFSAEENAGSIIVKTVKVCAEINTASGDIIWKHANGSKWLSQKKPELTETDVIHYNTGDEEPIINRVKTVDGERNFIQNLKAEKVRTAYRGKLFFTWKEDEEIHGLGQAEEGIYNYRGHCQYLYQHNMRIPMPVLVSTEGYGILVDCCSLMTFNDDLKDSYLFLDTVDQIDYYFMGGHTMDEIIHDYRYLTGKAQMLPKWAYGYVQSKEQYYTAKELLEIVRHYREIGVPLDCVVQDWNTWDPGNWGEKILDQKRYGDMKECAEEIHKLNAHTMVSVWPNMNAGGKNHTEFFKTGHLLYDYATYDAFNEEAREMYWKQAQEGLFDQGFDSWWCDSTEPFSGPDWSGAAKREPWERYELVGGEHKKYLDPAVANAFALMLAKGIYENKRKTTE